MKWLLAMMAVLLAGAVLIFGLILSGFRGQETRDLSRLQAQLVSLRAQLGQAEARLSAASTTGDLISCPDLRQFEQNVSVPVNGTDAYGNYLTLTGYGMSSWLPGHCYKP